MRRRETTPRVPAQVAILTGGGDRPYALGLAACLIEQGIVFDFIGSDALEEPTLFQHAGVRFLNLRGDQRTDVPLAAKMWRVARYYVRLLRYAWRAESSLFHILWNNKLEYLDRTLVLAYYRLIGKRVVLTVHNVNIRKRDGRDSFMNRLTLWVQYRLVDHLFVHTERMKRELENDFGLAAAKISVIPFGVNSTVPDTALTSDEARRRFGFDQSHKVVLFFGNIAPYKGLEYLVEALSIVSSRAPEHRLIIAGRPKGAESYWASIRQRITDLDLDPIVTTRIEYVADAETEVYFKAADVIVLPYTHVFQSGVMFLGYNFGLPIIASDVASLKDDIVEGRTGYVCPPADPVALAKTIEQYFASDLYADLAAERGAIQRFARERYSWKTVGDITAAVYRMCGPDAVQKRVACPE